jgi:hypothetical protein
MDQGEAMIDGLEPLFQQIAESMLATIPEEWAIAQFEAIFYADSSTYEAEYTRRSDGKARGFQPAGEGSRAFRQIRARFKAAGKPLWCRASFQLHPDGSFNIQWGYDGCDENGNAPFDEEEVIRRHEERHNWLTS